MAKFFPISQPSITNLEKKYVSEAMRSGWISSSGSFIDSFEYEFAKFCKTDFCISVSNGTTGLHLALKTLGVGFGDEVIVPDFTFIATANSVVLAGAKPIFVDIKSDSLTIDLASIENAITKKTKAIIPVHIYGHPANMKELCELASKYNIKLIEDCAEAHGASIEGQPVGSFGDIGVFSFYGNKIITTGEGGALVTKNKDLALKAKMLRGHGMSTQKKYWHEDFGYNYRLTNVQAAIGLAQLERIEYFLEKRRKILNWYKEDLEAIKFLSLNKQTQWAKSVCWLVCMEFESFDERNRNIFMQNLLAEGVDSRPYFSPLSQMPMYSPANTPVTKILSLKGVNLPTYVDMRREDVKKITNLIRSSLKKI